MSWTLFVIILLAIFSVCHFFYKLGRSDEWRANHCKDEK